jgi:SAM-dependent methyltransferase
MSSVERYYDDNADKEWLRLERDRIEFAVSLRVLDDHLPTPPARVLDVGGGPGRYAIELARRGYAVTLADISAAELEVAGSAAKEACVTLDGIVRADARDLAAFDDGAFDAVILMGPLYHLLDEDDRRSAAGEALRVTGPGGVVFAAFITRYSALRYWAKYDPMRVVDNLAWHRERLHTGRFDNAEGFTDFYAARPHEVIPLMEACGWQAIDLVGCEGVVSMIRDRVNELEGDAWDAWVELNYELGRDPATHACAEHLLYVGRKPHPR